MNVRRVVEITIQTTETVVLRSSQVKISAHCPACRAELEMLTAGAAAARAAVPLRWIYRWIETGELHFQETPTGVVLICPNSLERTAQFRTAHRAPQNPNLEEK